MRDRETVFSCREGDCTSGLQAELNAAAEAGTTLVLGPGVHHCGALKLPSGLHLHFEEGAILRLADTYDAYESNKVDVIAESSDRAALLAQNASGIRISGKGLIDGQGAAFITGYIEDMGTHVPAALRPRVLVFENCSDITLEDFSVHQSPMWTIHLIGSDRISIQRLHVDNDREMPNTDGIVIDACTNVTINACNIATADDGVVLKTSAKSDGQPAGICRSITASNCVIESRSCALKLGTESFGNFENIQFVDCKIVRSNRALGIFSRDGGAVRNVLFQRIDIDCEETPEGFWGSGEAITVNCIDRRKTNPAGTVENLVFEDITGRMEGAINLVADAPAGIRNVALRRVSVRQEPSRFNGLRYDVRPTRFDLEPSPDAAGRANAWIKDAEGKVIGLVDYPDGMPGVFASNVENLELNSVSVSRPAPLPAGWHADEIVVLSGVPNRWT
ncbi:glycoside hydrolase family 28 protein [Roseibium litorale]|uniref:Glycoside hydrolase family 28 protein n=1 Tax=Roseibium litorale TaxID=2803841 RepID=A0ABR9CPS0_9HYPH|nr:glycosyl hydrolase family 28 protein [Roseibium litorale]MBD8892287.1 glycoside hydrolase family 28 protein [Roseibium litorale]